jgi:hypothetical protein
MNDTSPRISPRRRLPVRRSVARVLVAVLLAGGVAACTGSDDERPSRAELARAVSSQREISLDDAEADCVAGKLLASDLSAKVLRGVVRDDDRNFSQEDRTRLGEEITKAVRACLPAQ